MASKATNIEFLLSQVRNTAGSLASGTVTVYDAGTSNLATIWTDRDKSSAAANPYTLDANGTAQLYADGLIKVVIKNSTGTTIYTRDYLNYVDYLTSGAYQAIDGDYASLNAAISAIGATPTTLLIRTAGFSMTGAAVVPATLSIKLEYPGSIAGSTYALTTNGGLDVGAGSTINSSGAITINGPFSAPLTQVFAGTGAVTGLKIAYPEWFGATTSSSDNSVAFIAAFTTVGAGGVVKVSKGTWNITSTITGTAADQTIEGDSWDCIINQTSTATSKGGISTAYDGLTVRNLQIASPLQVGYENAAIAAVKGDLSAISDIRVENCYLNNFSYGVSITHATRPRISNNYIYSTGDDSTDTGGTLQLSQITDGHITDNVITGDASHRFQHGIYLSGDIDGLEITGNIIRDGFYSYGIHIYGSTFTNGRKNIIISKNIIDNITAGILISRATAGTGPTYNVRITDNIIKVDNRAFYAAGDVLSDFKIGHNYFESGGSATTTNVIFEVAQSAGEELNNFDISQNTFANFKTGGIDLNNAVSMQGVKLNYNIFQTDAAGLAPLLLDDPSTITTEYSNIEVIGNTYVGTNALAIGSLYSDWRNATWMTMHDNSWDTGAHGKVTLISTTPYTVLGTDEVIWVTTAADAITLALPAIATVLDGRKITVCKIDAGAGTAVLDPNSSELVNGSSTLTLSARWATAVIQAVRGSGWILVGSN